MSIALRQQLVATAQAMNGSGLNVGTSGNLSARCADGLLITPSGMTYETLQADDIVQLDSGGAPTGRRRPSSEWRFHLAIYQQRSDVQAVVHAHAPHATSLACLGRDIPAFHYEVALAGGDSIRCAGYATFGTQALSDQVLAALQGRRACLMANHGMLAVGASLPAALLLAQQVEQLARIYLHCLQAGEPTLLDAQEMAVVLEKFSRYGPNAQSAD